MCTGMSWNVPQSSYVWGVQASKWPPSPKTQANPEGQIYPQRGVSGLMSSLQVSSLCGPGEGPRLSAAFSDT